ncbi:hypothetical protein CEXT_707051 [Caerostris extrusa]|uniref:Uncharacterized protein n=1 Tax=Caerostris extrusa TaxID=172846 RepID=A0AAV4TAR3_CAEEX|nr:hypothetical protein CEXT_707051 [Caerostris extrusa]
MRSNFNSLNFDDKWFIVSSPHFGEGKRPLLEFPFLKTNCVNESRSFEFPDDAEHDVGENHEERQARSLALRRPMSTMFMTRSPLTSPTPGTDLGLESNSLFWSWSREAWWLTLVSPLSISGLLYLASEKTRL